MDYSKFNCTVPVFGGQAMRKSVHTWQYATFLKLLRQAREDAGVTQVELAKRLRMTQSAVSKCERGERRLDMIEVRSWCRALGLSLPAFAQQVDRALET